MTFDEVKAHYEQSVAKAAQALDVSRMTLYRWRDSGIPRDTQIDIELKTRGALKADLPKQVRKMAA